MIKDSDFKHDYNVDELVSINFRDIKLKVTPRFVDQYKEDSYERLSLGLFKQLASDSSNIADIGAHYGVYGIIAAKQNRSAIVTSVEPVLENFEILKKNIKLNKLSNVRPLLHAASSQNGDAIIQLTGASDNAGFHGHPNSKTEKKQKVKAITLDSIYGAGKKLDLLKIDSEGHEIEVLKGAKDTINSNDKLRMLIEFNPKCLSNAGHEPQALLKLLADYNFEVFCIDEQKNIITKITQDKEKWAELSQTSSFYNLLCLPKGALLVTALSHTSAFSGGAERSLYNLMEYSLRHNILWNLILPKTVGNKVGLAEFSKISAVNEIEFGWWTLPTKKQDDNESNTEPLNAAASISIANLVKKTNCDLTLTNSSVAPWLAIASRMANKPHTWFVREYGEEDMSLRFALDKDNRARFIDKYSDFIFFNSEALRKEFAPLMHIQKTAVVNPSFNNFPLSSTTLGLSNNKNVKLLLYGSIQKGKGQLVAVRAVNELHKKGIRAKLSLIGCVNDKQYIAEIKKYITSNSLEKHILISGHKKNIANEIAKHHIVLVCSSKEAFGRVAVEPMLQSRLVIASDSGGLSEIIQDGKNGLLFEPGDYIKLSKKITSVLVSQEYYQKLCMSGYETAVNKYTRHLSEDLFVKTLKEQGGRLQHSNNYIESTFYSYLHLVTNEKSRLETSIDELLKSVDSLNKDNEALTIELKNITESKKWRYVMKPMQRTISLLKKIKL